MPEAALSPMAVYSARPTVRVDGAELLRVSELLLAMEMREREGGLSALELRFSNVASDPEGGAGPAFEDEERLRLGSKIAVYAGDASAPREIFRGTVTALEAEFPELSPPELLVLAEDDCQQARMARRTAVHRDVSIADLARAVAARHGLTPRITGFTDGVGTRVQLNESDLAFLGRLLRRYDGDLQVVGRELHVSPRGEVRRGALELELHSQLRQVRMVADLAHQVTEVTVSGWDPVRGQRVSAASRGASLEPGRGRRGAEVLFDALGERSEHLGRPAVTTAEEARALADAAFDRRARRFVCAEGTAEGNPALRVGTHVQLTGISARFDNTYYVVSACHRFDVVRGYETDFEAECAALGYP
ncbi:MAG: phage late control D family protein [bacterium]|nr:phage late control D family protein [bacterium]